MDSIRPANGRHGAAGPRMGSSSGPESDGPELPVGRASAASAGWAFRVGRTFRVRRPCNP